MKNLKQSAELPARVLLALLAGIFFIPNLRAQNADQPAGNRVLFVFDTSSAMKKRLTAEEKSIQRLFALTLAEQMQPGDSIGVWTFDQDVRTGQFPLEHWNVHNINSISSNVLYFIENQHYSKTTSFAKLIPLINHIAAS